MTAARKSPLYCSFCGKSQHEVRRLIAGTQVYICNECVDLCTEILDEHYIKGVTITRRLAEEIEDTREDTGS